MAKKEKNNLKDRSIDDLKKELVDLKENVRMLRFKTEGSKSKNVKEYSSLKKKIARVLTEINSRNKSL